MALPARSLFAASLALLSPLGSGQGEKPRAALEQAYAQAKSAKAGEGRCEACVWWARVKATVQLATATMNAPDLAAKQKYPAALRLYREALALHPENTEALENSAMIESIYRDMGRDVPQ